jgi:ParB family chromosome partitioning protein
MKRKALGKGLDALIPKVSEEKTLEVDVDLLSPNPHQPRLQYNEEKMVQLQQSIKSNGILQPILVRRLPDGYQIIAGERRWRAAQLLGMLKVPVIIRDVPEDKILELSLIENIQREELTPIEEAEAYNELIARMGLTQQEVADRVGKDRSSIANYLRLLKLPPKIKEMVMQGLISMGHCRTLLGLDDAKEQEKVANQIITKGHSVRQVEALVRKIKLEQKPRRVAKKAPDLDVFTRAAEEKLEKLFSTKVIIKKQGKGGSIVIRFFSDEDLDRIYNILIKR